MNFGRVVKTNSGILTPSEFNSDARFSTFDKFEKETKKSFLADKKDFSVKFILLKTNKISNVLVTMSYKKKEVFRQYIVAPSSFYIRQLLETLGENNVYSCSLDDLISDYNDLNNLRFVFDSKLKEVLRAVITVPYFYDATVVATEDDQSQTEKNELIVKDEIITFSLDLISIAYQLIDSFFFIQKENFRLIKPVKSTKYKSTMVMFLGATQSGKSTSINYAIENREKGIYPLDKGKISYFRMGEPELTVFDTDKFENLEGSISNWLDVVFELAFGSNPNVIVDSTRTLGRLSSFNLMSQGISSDIVDIFTFLPKLSSFVGKTFVVIHNPLESDTTKLQGMVELFHSSIPLIYFFPNSLSKDGSSVDQIEVSYNIYSREAGNKLNKLVTYNFSSGVPVMVSDDKNSGSSIKRVQKSNYYKPSSEVNLDVSSGSDYTQDNDFRNF